MESVAGSQMPRHAAALRLPVRKHTAPLFPMIEARIDGKGRIRSGTVRFVP